MVWQSLSNKKRETTEFLQIYLGQAIKDSFLITDREPIRLSIGKTKPKTLIHFLKYTKRIIDLNIELKNISPI